MSENITFPQLCWRAVKSLSRTSNVKLAQKAEHKTPEAPILSSLEITFLLILFIYLKLEYDFNTFNHRHLTMEGPCGQCAFPLQEDDGDDFCMGDTPLMYAALYGHVPCINAWLQAGVHVNAVNKDGDTALHLASNWGSLGSVQRLIEAGADVNLFSNTGETALIEASITGSEKCANLLIESGACVNARVARKFTALMHAAGNGLDKCVDLLLRKGANVNAIEKRRQTALFKAANKGQKKCVDLLLKAGAYVNISDVQQMTPLMHSVMNGHYACFELLVASGADVNTKLEDGRTNMFLAVKNCRERYAKSQPAEKQGTNEDYDDHHKCIDLLLKEGAGVNTQCDGGRTALMLAAAHGHSKCVEKLKQAGANVNTVDNNGTFALLFACNAGDSACVDSLLQAGADVNLKDQQDTTPLISASAHGSHQLLAQLLKAGAHINRRNTAGLNALYYALGKIRSTSDTKHTEAVTLLFAAGETFIDASLKMMARYPRYRTVKETFFEQSLKHLCKEAIRKRLIQINPHEHLFHRVHQLGLPAILTEYLLYHTSLHQ